MTRTRIVALALIGVVALGLAYLKLGTADDPVSVPAGAVADDLILEPCTYSTEDGSYAAGRSSCPRIEPILNRA